MKQQEIKKAIKFTGGLFGITVEQAKFLNEHLAQFDYDDAVRAIKKHRAINPQINFPQLLKEFEQEKNGDEGSRANSGSWPDIYRQQAPYLKDASDFEVILRIHRGWARKSGGGDSYKTQLTSSCVYRLIAAGMDQKVAPDWAATIFDDSIDYFRQVLNDLRDQFPAKPCAQVAVS